MEKEKNQILIGLEVHITLKSKKKIFNWTDTYTENIPPNSQISPWELGYLGTLPIINPKCVELALKLALALQAKISPVIIFDRKIYHYYDLPKGYQITQSRQTLANYGYLPLITSKGIKNISLRNLQLEEDTSKSFYTEEGIELDFNRAGNPLIELTTEPIFHNSEETILFLRQLQNLLRYLDISEAKMEKGQLRVDLNFSLNLADNYQTPRYEVKNLNSFNAIEKVLKYEINKHHQLWKEKKAPPLSQTFGFDEKKQITIPQREKNDYFYLPESNIPPIEINQKDIQKIAKNIPILPWIKWEQLIKNGVNPVKANLIMEKPILLKTINILEKKGVFSAERRKNF
ncbi:MAG: aspartyl/glutamyl-tRNA(Asn/Gln) amidotransferase subunit B [Mycoplasmataceae bacterium CE_OT135]|nr:MAG: aspartyl/glutamyl-tRNA(Asn/Gln) amidotransferase subunit B [Mycoplasmataceae bacterium CE_OT135]